MPRSSAISYTIHSGTTERLWTTEQVADYLGVPVRTIYAWRKRGHGPKAFRIGKHLRFRPADVHTWLDQHTA